MMIPNLTRCHFVEPQEELNGCGFATPTWSHECDGLPTLYLEVKVVQNLLTEEVIRYRPDFFFEAFRLLRRKEIG